MLPELSGTVSDATVKVSFIVGKEGRDGLRGILPISWCLMVGLRRSEGLGTCGPAPLVGWPGMLGVGLLTPSELDPATS